MLASWEWKRQDLKRQITNNFAIDVTNFQLMVDDIQKEAKAYREKFPGDDKASKLADHLDRMVLNFQSRLDKIYDQGIFNLRIASWTKTAHKLLIHCYPCTGDSLDPII